MPLSYAEAYWHAFNTIMQQFVEAETHTEALPLLDSGLDLLQAVRDRELLDAIGHGDRQLDIAQALGISQQAVSGQVKAARQREIARRKGMRSHGDEEAQ